MPIERPPNRAVTVPSCAHVTAFGGTVSLLRLLHESFSQSIDDSSGKQLENI